MRESFQSDRPGAGPPVATCARPAATSTQRLSGLAVSGDAGGDRMVINVWGELDLAEDDALRHVLRTGGTVDLAVRGAEFCDCSGVGILLSVTADDGAEASAPRREGPEDDPCVELAQLRRAMRSRGTIDLARGILMATFALSSEGAWRVLIATSQNTNIKLHRLAQQVVDSTTGAPLPRAVRDPLSAAVAKCTTAPGGGT
ncbi:ANTAR domain-containing protein [Streptomyces sp. NPDC048696]|uniref:ANTAR domain-containing protein n=1 Tax=Streptomyces sp. NPDC048696 TaxID=3365585 RepID=UPI0037182146